MADNTLDYVELDDIPVAGPDPYSDAEKRETGTAAEQKLEADVNDGGQIDDVSKLHKEAVAAWATYRLASGPIHPRDAKSGDFYNGSGEDQAEFASEMKNLYQSDKASILSSGEDESSDSSEFVV